MCRGACRRTGMRQQDVAEWKSIPPPAFAGHLHGNFLISLPHSPEIHVSNEHSVPVQLSILLQLGELICT